MILLSAMLHSSSYKYELKNIFLSDLLSQHQVRYNNIFDFILFFEWYSLKWFSFNEYLTIIYMTMAQYKYTRTRTRRSKEKTKSRTTRSRSGRRRNELPMLKGIYSWSGILYLTAAIINHFQFFSIFWPCNC